MPRPGSAQRWAASVGRGGCRLLALLLLPLLLLPLPGPGGASEITFELPDNAKQCFYEDITQGTKCTLEFQVITGGHYDVDCRLEDPDGNVLYKEMKKQYDSFTFTASKNGTYKFCFSNEFSTFTHKTVYFDFQVGEDPPLFPSENRVSALTQMESACVSIHEALKSVIDYQTHFRLREAQGRSRAEDLNTRVAYWSVGEALILLVVSIGQVFLLKSFFSDKRTTTTPGVRGARPRPARVVGGEQAPQRPQPAQRAPDRKEKRSGPRPQPGAAPQRALRGPGPGDQGAPRAGQNEKQCRKVNKAHPFPTWMLRMGVGKSRIHPCPFPCFWGKSPRADRNQTHLESGGQRPGDISLCNATVTAEDGQEGPEEMPREEEDEDDVFLKFVILHSEDDTQEALRVQHLLQSRFGIQPGIIFAEMPGGRQHLQNLDHAVNGSAWTILLLTENFLRDTWCHFQFHTSLMNSVNRQHKYNSVIPMRPLNRPLPRERTPFPLRTINALEEQSQGFATQVQRIFRDSVYQTQQNIWRETRGAPSGPPAV
ncbi:uncharacterized protein LOC103112541 [Erinaceus europaeus]|uniref:Uncharacterized protein LOC103112541 n=1 Tax=Erinaceus europaeus TaxID=9365 RepID=A0ABM3VSG1_ERIEU|nr:uncharacterized protein LOC103112541 [Erinaceus europaeus]